MRKGGEELVLEVARTSKATAGCTKKDELICMICTPSVESTLCLETTSLCAWHELDPQWQTFEYRCWSPIEKDFCHRVHRNHDLPSRSPHTKHKIARATEFRPSPLSTCTHFLDLVNNNRHRLSDHQPWRLLSSRL